MSTLITTKSDLLLDSEDIVVTLRKPVLVAMGEYADQGEPDILIHIVHALDDDGNDCREFLARVIAKAIEDVRRIAESIAGERL